MRIIYNPDGSVEDRLPISLGGTGQDSGTKAAKALNVVTYALAGKPGQAILLDEEGKMPASFRPEGVNILPSLSLEGPTVVLADSVTNYRITNYDSFTDYIVTASGGTAVQKGEDIVFTAGSVGEEGYLKVNDLVLGLTIFGGVDPRLPKKPVFAYPTSGSTELDLVLEVRTSPFEGSPGDTHLSTDWELASDANFSDIIQKSYADANNLTTWSLQDMKDSTQYYVRARHRGAIHGVGPWSTGSTFITKGIWKQSQKLAASDGSAEDYFGVSCALNAIGDIALIGAHHDDDKGNQSGSVYVFTRNGSVWTQQQKLYASDGKIEDRFGSALALNATGDLALIGAVGDSTKAPAAGSFYVFTRSGTVWTQQQKLFASDAEASDWLGHAIALNAAGDLALIGAYGDDDKAADAGSVYVFTRSGSVWTQQQKLVASDGTAGDIFGVSCALNAIGDIALIGAPHDDGVNTGAGSVYVFTRTGTVWTQQQKLLASDGSAGDQFGMASALNAAGDLAFIGARQDDDKGTDSGSVYVFTRNGTTWRQQQKLLASDGAAGDIFGCSSALNGNGDMALIGARQDDDKGTDSGSVYVFIADAKSLPVNATQKFYSSDIAAGDYFGISVALNAAGDLALVGAAFDSDKGLDSGSVYVFTKIGNTWTQQQKIYASDAKIYENFGRSVALNSDATIALIGQGRWVNNSPSILVEQTYGYVYYFTRQDNVWTQRQKFTGDGPTPWKQVGNSLSLSSDGSMALICAIGDDANFTDSGSVYVFTRTGTVWTQQQKLTASDAAPGDLFGISAALNAAGDLALIGAAYDDDKGTDSGSVYVFTRTGTVWTQQQKLLASDGVAGDRFGMSCTMNAAGDLALIGASGDDDRNSNSGSFYFFTRSGSTWTQARKLTAPDGNTNDGFGTSCALNADGSILLAGASGDNDKGALAGAVYEFVSTVVSYPVNEKYKLSGSDTAAGDTYGAGIALNQLGTVAIVGSPKANSVSGSAYVHTREGEFWNEQKLVPTDNSAGDNFGQSSTISGDGTVILVGAHGDDDKGTDSGSVYAYEKISKLLPTGQQQKLLASDGVVSDGFGVSCALNATGDLALIGAMGSDTKATDAGCAYVFTRAGTVWTQQQKLLASDGTVGDWFGQSCALNAAGDLALIGAPLSNPKGDNSGSVYVFTRTGTVWTQQQKLTASDGIAYDVFGNAIALNATGDMALIGAQYNDDKGTDAGTVYVFTRSGSVWTQQQKLYSSDIAAEDYFGSSCALNAAGDLAFIGARQDDDSGFNSGSVYVFTRVGSVWTQQQKIYGSDVKANDHFGESCALNAAGDLALIGAALDDSKGINSGSVYLFTRSGTVWTQQQRLTASDAAASDYFGRYCALNAAGDLALIGAYFDDDKATDAGSVYVFAPPSAGKIEYKQTQRVTALDAAANDGFGCWVTMNAAGDLALIGAIRDDDKGNESGSVYVFTRIGSTWTQQQKLTASDGTAGDIFGVSCALNAIGDIALIGAYGDDDKATDAGSVYVFTRSGNIWTQQQKLLASDGIANDYFGVSCSLNAAGDLALIGASRSDTKAIDAGCVYVFTRSGSTWTQKQKLLASDGVRDDFFGYSCALNAAGDLALIGSVLDDDKGTDSGSIYVFSLVNNVWTQAGKILAPDGVASDWFGLSCSLCDSLGIAMIGAINKDVSASNSGAVYLYSYSGTVFTYLDFFTHTDQVANDYFGHSVAISADGKIVLVGSAGKDTAATDTGAFYSFQLKPNTVDFYTQTQKLLASDGAALDYFGWSVAVSQDGNTAIVGARNDDSGKGSAYIFVRIDSVWTQQAKIQLADAVVNDYFGHSVAISANGNTVVIGAPGRATYGYAYAYTRSGVTWTKEANLAPADRTTFLLLGQSVSISANGNTAAVGAPTSAGGGKALVFTRSAGVWTIPATGTLSSTTPGTAGYFGNSVALSALGDVLLVGAPSDPVNGTNSGSAYTFVLSSSGWKERMHLLPFDNGSGDAFGGTLAISGNGVAGLISSRLDDDRGTDAGAVYYFS